MPEEINKTIYICPYCADEFDDEFDCADHIDDCLNKQPPKERDKLLYACLCCHKIYDDEHYAEICENKHKLAEDDFYLKFLDYESRRRLKEAGNHPRQAKL